MVHDVADGGHVEVVAPWQARADDRPVGLAVVKRRTQPLVALIGAGQDGKEGGEDHELANDADDPVPTVTAVGLLGQQLIPDQWGSRHHCLHQICRVGLVRHGAVSLAWRG